MSFTNFQKTIALTSGVLVLSCAIGLIVIAWTGPNVAPPDGNAPAPINVGGIAQTKAGDLTVANLSLNGVGNEGDITNADEIIGYNDLQLRADEIKLYTGGTERMTVGADGNLYVPGLLGLPCFLEAAADGKVKCYTGSIPPGGDVIHTPQNQLLNVDWCDGEDADLTHTFLVGDNKDRVIKIVYSLNAGWGTSYFYFYVDDGTGEVEYEADVSGSTVNEVVKTWYYHIPNMFPVNNVKIRIAVSSTIARSDCCSGTNRIQAWAYELNAKRGNVNWASSQGEILYYYTENVTDKMSIPTVPGDYHQNSPPTSVIISAKDEFDVTISE